MKKAIELQFHWIFVLIAGAIILGFFFTVVQKQRSYAEQRVSIRLSSDIEAVFSGAIESKGTVQFLPTPSGGINFFCSNACECTFGIGQKSTGFRDKIIFAPDFLDGFDIVAWALEWKQPFRVANFLYLTNQNIKYYLVYDENNAASKRLFSTMNKELPDEINLAIISDPSEIANLFPEGWQETRMAFLEINPYNYIDSLSEEWEKERLSMVHLSPPLVLFFEKEENALDFNSDTSLLAGEPTFYAAIFSSDKIMYDCNMESAFNRLANVGKVLSERTKILDERSERCIYFSEQVDSIVSIAQRAAPQMRLGNPAPVNELNSAVAELEQQNKQMIQESCPEIY